MKLEQQDDVSDIVKDWDSKPALPFWLTLTLGTLFSLCITELSYRAVENHMCPPPRALSLAHRGSQSILTRSTAMLHSPWGRQLLISSQSPGASERALGSSPAPKGTQAAHPALIGGL